jgi:Dolichyl-phosphate-mannose-protein mannosyltransferase
MPNRLSAFIASHYKALVSILFLMVAVGLLSLTVGNHARLSRYFVYSSYYFIFVMIFLWIFSILQTLLQINFSLIEFVKNNYLGLSIALILVMCIFLSVSVQFKTLSDETNLLAISKSMIYDKTIYNSTMGASYYYNYNSETNLVPIRPLVFPFFVSILHSLLGYSPNNPFILNFLVLFVLLSGVYVVVQKYIDVTSAIASMFLVCSFPIVTIHATSAGFDLISGLFFLIILLCIYRFIQSQKSSDFVLMWLAMIVWANIRYENVIFLFLFPLGLFVLRRLPIAVLLDNIHYLSLSVLLMIPTYWQRLLSQGKYENKGMPLFSVDHFKSHLTELVKALVDFDFFLPYATLLVLFSIPAGLITFFAICTRWRQRVVQLRVLPFAILVMGAAVSLLVIYLSHFNGGVANPAQARFFIILCLLAALAPVALKGVIGAALPSHLFLMGAIAMFLMYHPVAVEGRFINSLILVRTTKYSYDFLKDYSHDETLIINERPGQYAALNYSAVNFGRANQTPELYLANLERGFYTTILVFQRVSRKTMKPVKENMLSDKFELKILKTYLISASESLRISEVVR